MNKIEFAYDITDELEVCVRITNKEEFRYSETSNERISFKSIFYYEDMLGGTHIYLHKDSQGDEFIMNSEVMFIFGEKSLKYFNLNKEFTKGNLQEIGFELDKDEAACIQNLRVTNNPNIVIIIIDQKMDDITTVIVWNFKDKKQIDSFSITEEYIII
jgi:hypothetical protein